MKPKRPEEIRRLEDSLANYQGEDRIVTSTELAQQLDIDTPATHRTGIDTVDRILGGVEPGEMVIVSGPTGEGKTTLLMSMTANMSKAKVDSVWFTLEVTPKSFIQKIRKACQGFIPLFYMPNRNTENHLEWLEHRIVEAKVKHDVKVVFIDHIHQIFSLQRVKSASISLEIGDMVGKIKQMAIDYNVVVFLIAHTKDNSERPDAEPRKEDIRDSGLISRLADSIIMVWRVKNEDGVDVKRRPRDLEETDTKAKVRIVKNRREGKLGAFLMDHRDGMLTEIKEEKNAFRRW